MITFRQTIAILIVLLSLFYISPYTLSYVNSGSMQPTIEQGDLYVIGPEGEIKEGDIITFYSPQKEEFVTHRVVKVTEEGFITKGDANSVTDQSVGLSKVQKSQVIGEVISIGGKPLIIPHLGFLSMTFSKYKTGILSLLITMYVYGFYREKTRNKDNSSQQITHSQLINRSFLFVLAVSVAILLLLSSSISLTLYAVEEPRPNNVIPDSKEIPVNKEVERKINHNLNKVSYMIYYPDVENGKFVERKKLKTEDRFSTQTVIEINSFKNTGKKKINLEYYTYPQTLPKNTIEYLHHINPFLAAFSTVFVLVAPLWALAYVFLGKNTRVRNRIRSKKKQ